MDYIIYLSVLILLPHLLECIFLEKLVDNTLSRRKRAPYEDDEDIYMFRNPNVTIPKNRTKISLFPDWLLYATYATTRYTSYFGQRGVTRDWTTFAWLNERATVYLETFLKGLKKAPSYMYPRYRLPSTSPKSTTLSLFEQMTLFKENEDFIFKMPWAYAPHQNFRAEMGFGPNDTIDMTKVDPKRVEKFENKYRVTVMYQWPNTHAANLARLNYEKWNYTLVFSGEMSTKTPLNYSLVNFEEWFHPQVPRMKFNKVENLEYQLKVMFDDVFQLDYLDKHILNINIPHDELITRYKKFRNLRTREYKTWYRRKIWLPWKHLVKDGIREWFFARGKCIPSPGQYYFDEVNKQFKQLSRDMNETLLSYFYDFESQFLHFYGATFGPHWNLSLEEEHSIAYTRPTMFSPTTGKGEFYLHEKPGILIESDRSRDESSDSLLGGETVEE